MADDALRIKPDAPEAASGEDWFADNHLAETLAGKVPNVPIERRCIGAAALNRIYNIDLKECVTSNNDGVLGTRHSPLQRSCQSAGQGLLILWIPAFSRRPHGQPDITQGIFQQHLPPRPCRWNPCGGEKQRSCGTAGGKCCPQEASCSPWAKWFQDWRK